MIRSTPFSRLGALSATAALVLAGCASAPSDASSASGTASSGETEALPCIVSDQGGFDEALGLLASGALPVDALLEPDEVGLDGLLDAMRDLAEGRRAGKVLVRP